MRRAAVEDYLRSTASVEGWFFPIDAFLFGLIDEIQKELGIRGDLFEIGVHHGKTAIFLARMLDEGETLGVCDVFEQQELNRDHSGEGNRAIFLRHMETFVPAAAGRLRVFAGESSLLTPAETTRDCRFMHIDGGHRPEDVHGDLKTALAALQPGGIVAVDDVFNPSWPGVSEGFYHFMRKHPAAFVPLLIGGNKVLLSRPEAAARYDAFLQRPDRWREAVEPQPFSFGLKSWFGREVATAVRMTWVDLDPEGAARKHAV